jgi:hypothetical protein
MIKYVWCPNVLEPEGAACSGMLEVEMIKSTCACPVCDAVFGTKSPEIDDASVVATLWDRAPDV